MRLLHQLGKKSHEIKAAIGTHAPQQKASFQQADPKRILQT
jgi:hypothetical protein